MNTSRVPGITRNSGWHTVAAEATDARADGQRRDEPTTSKAERSPDDRAREPGR